MLAARLATHHVPRRSLPPPPRLPPIASAFRCLSHSTRAGLPAISPRRTLTSSSHSQSPRYRSSNASGLLYTASAILLTLGMSYAAVPLYRIFCSATGIGGTPQIASSAANGASSTDPDGKFHRDRLVPRGEKRYRVTFQSSTSPALRWSFRPSQHHVDVLPGETALAFYRARNVSDQDVVGVATYNVMPAKAGIYFNKIQCFCFEEQWLKAGEEVDMPVFFFLDSDIDDDPAMWDVDEVVLAYTFFKASGSVPVMQAVTATATATATSNPAAP